MEACFTKGIVVCDAQAGSWCCNQRKSWKRQCTMAEAKCKNKLCVVHTLTKSVIVK